MHWRCGCITLKHAVQLRVGENNIDELPGGLAHAARLLALDASCNRLSSLQAGVLSGLHGLMSLNLSQNLLKGQLLPEIGCLTRCSIGTSAGRNLFRQTLSVAKGDYDHSGALRLELLDLSQNRLSALPPTLGQCTGLVELLLGSNQLTSIPDEAGQLNSLRTLNLCRNRCNTVQQNFCFVPEHMMSAVLDALSATMWLLLSMVVHCCGKH